MTKTSAGLRKTEDPTPEDVVSKATVVAKVNPDLDVVNDKVGQKPSLSTDPASVIVKTDGALMTEEGYLTQEGLVAICTAAVKKLRSITGTEEGAQVVDVPATVEQAVWGAENVDKRIDRDLVFGIVNSLRLKSRIRT